MVYPEHRDQERHLARVHVSEFHLNVVERQRTFLEEIHIEVYLYRIAITYICLIKSENTIDIGASGH